MSYKPDESTLTAYLYGELAKDEHELVADYLESHPEVKKELEEIKSMQKMMGKLQDKEVTEPSFVFENPSVVVVSKNTLLSNFMKLTIGMAASIALLLLVGYFTELNITFQNQGMQLSFGSMEKTINPEINGLSKEEINDLMQASLASNNEVILSKIEELETDLTTQVDLQKVEHSQQIKSLKASNKIDQGIIDQYVSQLKEENKDIILSLVTTSEQTQREYMNTVIADFSAYLEQQRGNDLEVIQASFDNLKDNTEINQIETNEILASIISTVNNSESQF